MSVSNYTPCPAGTWTQLYSGPSATGVANLWCLTKGLEVKWKATSASPPWSDSGTVTTQQGPEQSADFWYTLPTPWAVIDVNPPVPAMMKIS